MKINNVIFVVLVAVLVAVVMYSMDEQKRWDAFASQHKCKVVERKPAYLLPMPVSVVGANGQVTVTTTILTIPAQTAFICDDGVIHLRSE